MAGCHLRLALAAACLLLCAGAPMKGSRALLQYSCATAEAACKKEPCKGKITFECDPATARTSCTCVSAGLAGCFPGAATVHTSTGEVKPLSALQLGESVLSVGGAGGLQYSPVYMWSSRRGGESATFLRVHTDAGVNITVTPGHYLFAWQGANSEQKAAAAMNETVSWPYVLPTKVKVGDIIPVASVGPPGGSGVESRPTLARVTAVEEVQEQGVFMPHTRSGAIVVDGVVASELTSLVPSLLAGNKASRILTITMQMAYHSMPQGVLDFFVHTLTSWAHGGTADGAVDYEALFGYPASAA